MGNYSMPGCMLGAFICVFYLPLITTLCSSVIVSHLQMSKLRLQVATPACSNKAQNWIQSNIFEAAKFMPFYYAMQLYDNYIWKWPNLNKPKYSNYS